MTIYDIKALRTERVEARHCDQRPSSPRQPPKHTAKTSTAEVQSIYDGEDLAVLVIIRYGKSSITAGRARFSRTWTSRCARAAPDTVARYAHLHPKPQEDAPCQLACLTLPPVLRPTRSPTSAKT